MARLRKGISYRKIERPYTRFSKFRKKTYIKSRPHSSLVRSEMGDPKRDYNYQINLITRDSLQIRHNSIESARLLINKRLEGALGKNYHLQIRIYPHHILRENSLASGAGADRLSMGMKKAFGKPISSAAQVKEGQILIALKINKKIFGKKVLEKAKHKLPCSTTIEIIDLKKAK